MHRRHYTTIQYRHEHRDPDGRFGHKPTFTGERPSALFDWDRALSGLDLTFRSFKYPVTWTPRKVGR